MEVESRMIVNVTVSCSDFSCNHQNMPMSIVPEYLPDNIIDNNYQETEKIRIIMMIFKGLVCPICGKRLVLSDPKIF